MRNSMIPSTRNMNKTTPRHRLIKLIKSSDKEKHFKWANKQVHDMCRGKTKTTADYSSKQCKQDDSGTMSLKDWKKKNTDNLEFYTQQGYVSKTKAKVKTFPEIQKPKEFFTFRLTRKQRLNEVLPIKGKWYQMEIWIHTKEWRATEVATT